MEKPGFLGYYAGSHWFMGAVAIVLLSLFALWLIDALRDAEEMAEKMVVESTERNMRVGLKVAMGETLIAGRAPDIARWAGSNPLRWVGVPPEGYRGDCPAGGVAELPPGSWCFDGRRGELQYRPARYRYLRLPGGAADGEPILRWSVARLPKDASFSGFVGVSVQLLTPYDWRKE